MTRRARSGFTILELLISMTMLSLILGTFLAVVLRVQREYTRQKIHSETHEALRGAEILITRVLRSAGADPYRKGFPALDPDVDGDGYFREVRVWADFNPPDGDTLDVLENVEVRVANDTLYVRWQGGTGLVPFTQPIRELTFEYYNKNGALLTTKAQVANATRVKATLSAPRYRGSSEMETRTVWIYLRNR